MKGQLIAIEGIDGAGKTTVAQFITKKLPNAIYCKGQGDKNSFWGRLARRFPSTFTFLVELFILNRSFVSPNLKIGKLVIHDRYYFSIMTHPKAQRWYNQLLFVLSRLFLKKPDKIILVEATFPEALKRLSAQPSNKFHEQILNNPKILDEQRKFFHELLTGQVALAVDTTNKQPLDLSRELFDFILERM